MSVRLWPELARARSATYIEPTEYPHPYRNGRVVHFAWIHLTQPLRGRPVGSSLRIRGFFDLSFEPPSGESLKRANDRNAIFDRPTILLTISYCSDLRCLRFLKKICLIF